MHLQDFFASLEVGQSHHDLAVEASRTEQCLVKHVGAVCCRNQDDAFVCSEAVHFHEQLVQCLFAFVVPATEACATLATYGVDFVNKQYTRSVLLAGLEQVAHAACAHAHEHFHEVRTRHAEERHSRFASDCACEESLAGTRRPDEKCPLRDSSTERIVFFWVLQELHEFLQVLLGLVATRHVVERGLLLRVVTDNLCLALAKAERVFAATAHLAARHYPEERNEDNDREECHDGVYPRSRFVDDFHLHALEHFPCGNLLVRDFEHVACKVLGVACIVGTRKARDGALVLGGFGNFFGGKLVGSLDDDSIGGLLERKFGNDLGGISHHGQKFGASQVLFLVLPGKREHHEQHDKHNKNNDKVPILERGGGLLDLAHYNPLYIHSQDTNFWASSGVQNSQILMVRPILATERLRYAARCGILT